MTTCIIGKFHVNCGISLGFFLFYPLCAAILSNYLMFQLGEREENNLLPSRKTKIAQLKKGLCGLLLCQIVQQATTYIFLFHICHSDQFKVLTALAVIFASGLIGCYLTVFLHEHSNAFFHCYDRVECYIILLIIGFHFYMGYLGIWEKNLAMTSYIPYYVFTIKGILLVFLCPSDIIFIERKQPEYVILKTWTGKKYQGKLSIYIFGVVLSLDEVKEIVDEKLKETDLEGNFFYFQIRSLRRVELPI